MGVYLDRLAEIAKRLTPAEGEETLQRVGAELLYAIILENDRLEHQLLGATRLTISRINIAAGGAGNFSTARYGAAVAGGVVGVVTHVILDPNNPAINIGIVPTAGAPGGFSNPAASTLLLRDARARGNAMNGWFTKNSAGAVLSSTTIVGQLIQPASGLPAIWPIGYVQTSGSQAQNQLYIESTAANQAVTVSTIGYERTLDAHEVDSTVV